MRQLDCKSYLDSLYEKYLSSELIPGLSEDTYDRERIVQDFIYGKNANRQRPVADNVIPILRNFQIKEDLFRRMTEAGISQLQSMNTGAGALHGTTLEGDDSDTPTLVYSYKLEMTASMDAIDAFINSLHSAYKTDRVYVIRSITLTSPYEDLVRANSIVADHRGDNSSKPARTTVADPTLPPEAQQPVTIDPVTQQPVAIVYSRSEYDLTDPHNPDYGETLFGDIQNEIKCTIVVDYLFYRAENITPQ